MKQKNFQGKMIKPLNKNDSNDADGDEDKTIFVSVFSSNNNALFQVAKSILNNNRIKFFSNGDYLNILNPAVYSAEIKVSEKDEETARKLLSDLVPSEYRPSNKFEKKMLSLRWYWNIGIIILFIILMIIIFLLLK